MIPRVVPFQISLLAVMENVLSQSQYFILVKVDDQMAIRWLPSGQGNEALCSQKCLWTDCPGFDWNNQTCFLLEPNQKLAIATRGSGIDIFIRNDAIQKVESAVAYNANTFYEFIPKNSPLKGLPMVFPDPPSMIDRVLMDFSWGFHLCDTRERYCYRWYFGTDDWIPMPALNFPHVEVRDAIRINGTWWILGGFWVKPLPQSKIYPHRISEYMNENGQWTKGPTDLKRYFEGLARISDTSLLAIGGVHTPKHFQSAIKVVSEFDFVQGPMGKRFNTLCPMFGTTCSDYFTQDNRKMALCLGGHCPNNSPKFRTEVFIYNLDTREWKEMPEWKFPETIRFSNLVWFQGKLYVIGAQYGESDRNTVYQFDETKQPAWTVIDILPDHPAEYSRVRAFTRSLIVI